MRAPPPRCPWTPVPGARRQEWIDGVSPKIRIEGYRVSTQPARDADRLARRGTADVATLRVDEHRYVGRDAGAEAFQGRDSGRPEGLVEGQVRLDGGRVR